MKKVLVCIMALLMLCSSAYAGTEALFETPIDGIYNYCPSIFMEDGVTHIYYCTNTARKVVTDSIGYRTSQDGVTYSDESIVLRKGANNVQWDGVHTCDPDVIKGKFMMGDVEYNYLMAYLGCKTTDCQINEVGLAVAQNPEGPWTKLVVQNPFVTYKRNTTSPGWESLFQWGVGQPTLVSMDKMGKVMLIYTKGDGYDTYLMCEKWDLSDLNKPVQIGEAVRITESGVISRDGSMGRLANADFVYDGETGTMYMVADGWPYLVFGDKSGTPTFITSAVWVLKYSEQYMPDEIEKFFVDQTDASWKRIGMVGEDESGYPRNHNAGVMTDPYGWKLEGDSLEIFHAVSQVNEPHDSLFTYRIHQWSVPIPE